MSLVKFETMLSIKETKLVKVGSPIKVLGLTKKIVSIESFELGLLTVKIIGTCEDFRQEPVNQLSMFGVDGL